jgi:hypothetical protein
MTIRALRCAAAALVAALIVLPALAQHESRVDLKLVAEGFNLPVHLDAPAEDDRLFVVDRAGIIYIVDGEGNLRDDPFLDLSDRIVDLREQFDERGLLGLAFHPDYADNGRFYVH